MWITQILQMLPQSFKIIQHFENSTGDYQIMSVNLPKITKFAEDHEIHQITPAKKGGSEALFWQSRLFGFDLCQILSHIVLQMFEKLFLDLGKPS